MYASCSTRLKKVVDREALDGRKSCLLRLIDVTKLEIRTNTNRLHALAASALLYWGHWPAQLTPLIRPLVQATQTEKLPRIAEECFYDSITLLLVGTRERVPCPHAKIVKQLAIGVVQVSRAARSSEQKDMLIVFRMKSLRQSRRASPLQALLHRSTKRWRPQF